MKGQKMKYKIIFFEVDRSYSYEGPLGCQTEEATEPHGIEVETDENGTPIISTLQGFGVFEDIKKCKNLIDLFCYLENNKNYIKVADCKQEAENFNKINDLERAIVRAICKELKEKAA